MLFYLTTKCMLVFVTLSNALTQVIDHYNREFKAGLPICVHYFPWKNSSHNFPLQCHLIIYAHFFWMIVLKISG